jgi:hypothetical protein
LTPKKLEHVARVGVRNKATVNTVKTAYEETSFHGTMAKFRADAADPKEKKAFDALSRSDNVNGVYWFLGDYHNALGDKKVTAIHTMLTKDKMSCFMIIDLGR